MTATYKRAIFPPKRRTKKYRKTAPPATAGRSATPEGWSGHLEECPS